MHDISFTHLLWTSSSHTHFEKNATIMARINEWSFTTPQALKSYHPLTEAKHQAITSTCWIFTSSSSHYTIMLRRKVNLLLSLPVVMSSHKSRLSNVLRTCWSFASLNPNLNLVNFVHLKFLPPYLVSWLLLFYICTELDLWITYYLPTMHLSSVGGGVDKSYINKPENIPVFHDIILQHIIY